MEERGGERSKGRRCVCKCQTIRSTSCVRTHIVTPATAIAIANATMPQCHYRTLTQIATMSHYRCNTQTTDKGAAHGIDQTQPAQN